MSPSGTPALFALFEVGGFDRGQGSSPGVFVVPAIRRKAGKMARIAELLRFDEIGHRRHGGNGQDSGVRNP